MDEENFLGSSRAQTRPSLFRPRSPAIEFSAKSALAAWAPRLFGAGRRSKSQSAISRRERPLRRTEIRYPYALHEGSQIAGPNQRSAHLSIFSSVVPGSPALCTWTMSRHGPSRQRALTIAQRSCYMRKVVSPSSLNSTSNLHRRLKPATSSRRRPPAQIARFRAGLIPIPISPNSFLANSWARHTNYFSPEQNAAEISNSDARRRTSFSSATIFLTNPYWTIAVFRAIFAKSTRSIRTQILVLPHASTRHSRATCKKLPRGSERNPKTVNRSAQEERPTDIGTVSPVKNCSPSTTYGNLRVWKNR